MIQVSTGFLYGFLGLLEAVLLLAGTALLLFLRHRRQQHEIDRLSAALHEVRNRVRVIRERASAGGGASDDYLAALEAQLQSSHALLGEDPFVYLQPPTGDAAQDRRRVLAIRHRFLEVEHQARLLGEDPAAREAHWAKGIEDLLERVLPEPETRQGAEGMQEPPSRLSIAQVRRALDEQQDLIRELRGMLEEELADSEQAGGILERLEEAETQAERIRTLLAGMESDASEGSGLDEDARMLLDLVGNQEQTIQQLDALVRDTLPESAAPDLLAETIDRIQRTNRELGNCVTVLENENSRLREEISALQHRVAELEAAGEDDGPRTSAGDSEASLSEPDAASAQDTPADDAPAAVAGQPLEERVQTIEEVDLSEPAPGSAAAAGEGNRTGTDDSPLPPPRPSPSWTTDL